MTIVETDRCHEFALVPSSVSGAASGTATSISDFAKHFVAGTRYASPSARTSRVRTIRQKEIVMHKIEPYSHDFSGDPVACFASDAEIEVADRLRRQLEERYLSPFAPSSPEPLRAGKDH
jgi:hypothetical protein